MHTLYIVQITTRIVGISLTRAIYLPLNRVINHQSGRLTGEGLVAGLPEGHFVCSWKIPGDGEIRNPFLVLVGITPNTWLPQ